jgi:putative membrane protein
MAIVFAALVLFVAFQHFGFFVLEMFFWDKPVGLKVFRQTAEQAAVSKKLAMNQGLYNGFLAAGLVWGVADAGVAVSRFFLGCVVAAGLFGGLTVSNRIIVVQAVPALIALGLSFI